MDASHFYRIPLTLVFALALAACNSGGDSQTSPSSGMTLSPPEQLNVIRMIDPDALFAEIVVSYQIEGVAEPVTQSVTASRGESTNAWNAALDIPVNTEFTLDIIWFDTLDGERLNLTQLSRSFNSGPTSGNLVLTFAFSEYDSADFNDDGDSFTNLEERENGTSPVVFDLPSGAPQDDLDNDGIPAVSDNCPNVSNSDQLNTDGDTLGDACDEDDDNDGSVDTLDCSPLDPLINPLAVEIADQIDNNCDGIVDNLIAGTDTDGDGVLDGQPDNCPNISNADQINSDNDELGDACDTDDDNDGSLDTEDCAPTDPAINPAATEVADQIDNNCNGVIDEEIEVDTDGDTIPDAAPDNCPAVPNTDQMDNDSDGAGDACDSDDDNDGSLDTEDCEPLNPAINPAATEVLDGMDTNCDGIVDNVAPEVVTSLQSLESCSLPHPEAAVICGEVVAADAVTPIVGAQITLADLQSPDPDSNCITDQLGEYACQLPDNNVNGAVNLLVAAAGFEPVRLVVEAEAGVVLNSAPVTLQGTSNPDSQGGQNWLVQRGQYDSVQSLLAQLKGCDNPDNCVDQGLTITNRISTVDLSPFDVAFINCGADQFDPSFDDPFNADEVGDFTRYRDFVDAGGHLYLTDLEAYVVQAMYPGKMNFKTGLDVGTIAGDIEGISVHTGLQSVVGPRFDIAFDLRWWTPILSTENTVTTFIEGDISNVSQESGIRPITIGFRPGPETGCVFFSSYHIEGESTGSSQELAMKYLVQNVNELCK